MWINLLGVLGVLRVVVSEKTRIPYRWKFSMAGIELDPESDLSENGVEDEARLECSPMLVEVLRYLLESGAIETVDDAIRMEFDEYNAVLICDAIVHACNTEDHDIDDMREFFEALSSDAKRAIVNMRSGYDRAGDGDSMAEFCEWSVQMSHLGTVCYRNLPYWEAEKSYDRDEEEDADYEIIKDLEAILIKVLQHLD